MVKYTGKGLVVKRPGVLSKVQMLNLFLGVGVFSFLPSTMKPEILYNPVKVWSENVRNHVFAEVQGMHEQGCKKAKSGQILSTYLILSGTKSSVCDPLCRKNMCCASRFCTGGREAGGSRSKNLPEGP